MRMRWRALAGHTEAPFLALDLLVLLLISINLLWLLVDAILLSTGTGVLISEQFPAFHRHYRNYWHNKLLIYDTIFTGFLLAELALRWGMAIYHKTYHRWFFYPFAHWYDVLGCIPIPGFRLLRLLRLVSIVYRLHKIGVIDLAESGLFRVLYKYYRLVIEELSDRIVVNVLDSVQSEVQQLGPVSHDLVERVISPRREVIVHWLGLRLAEVGHHAYQAREQDLHHYLDNAVHQAFAQNPDIRKLSRSVPVIGPRLENELRHIVSRLLTDIVSQLLSDLGKPGNAAMDEIAAALFDTLTTPEQEGMDDAVRGIVLDALELLKAQVQVQQWKLDEENQTQLTPPPSSGYPAN